ncbi:hypothetical protein, partial [Tannerella sp.]|uniref:hypothetical protein n=1 Tax=Tannerella sp. TaxID=2382127 RepID=UPI0026DDCC2B
TSIINGKRRTVYRVIWVYLDYQSISLFFFCHFWLDPKVKAACALYIVVMFFVFENQGDIFLRQHGSLSPCSLLRRLTAR